MAGPSDSPARRPLGVGKRLLFLGLTTALLLLLAEGAASWIVVGQLAWQRLSPIAERVHTQYDAELGWVNSPNVTVPDMYGPGIGFHTNAQGFRNDADVSPTEAP